MNFYHITIGAWTMPNGTTFTGLYSGAGDDKNVDADESVPDQGPIPEGLYTIGDPVDLDGGPHGPFVLPLTPDRGNVMHGRSGFLLHGDAIHAPGTASKGCIIASRLIRQAIAASGDKALTVTA